MNAAPNSFVVPREQSLSSKFLSAKGCRSPQEDFFPAAGQNFFFWARNALFHALRALVVPAGSRALLPAYVCRAAVEPFSAFGLACDFYDIGLDCQADPGEIEKRLHPDTRVLLAVHYFGFPQKAVEIRDLCRRRNVLLFEDCAHVLRGEEQGQPLGSFGDASVFSYRKFLPMFDGAELFFSDLKLKPGTTAAAESSRFGSRAAKHIVSQALGASSGLTAKALSGAVQAVKRLRGSKETVPVATSVTSAKETVDNNSASFDAALVNQPMTRASGWVLRHSDVPAIVNRRRGNFDFLLKAIGTIPGVTPLHREIGANVCPWVFPFFIDGVVNAHLLLRKRGIPAVTWGDVRPENLPEDKFPKASFLYDNLIFLPVHQDLSEEHLRMIVRRVKEVRSETVSLSEQRVYAAS